MRVQGKDVVLYAAAKDETMQEIGLSTTCDLQVNCDIKEFSSILSGRAKRVRPGRYGWQMSCDLIVDDADATGPSFLSAIKNGTKMVVSMNIEMPESTIVRRFYGECCVQSFQLSGALKSMATYKTTLVGDGDINIAHAEL